MYTASPACPCRPRSLCAGYIVHNERQLSPLPPAGIEKLSLFVEGAKIGLPGCRPKQRGQHPLLLFLPAA